MDRDLLPSSSLLKCLDWMIPMSGAQIGVLCGGAGTLSPLCSLPMSIMGSAPGSAPSPGDAMTQTWAAGDSPGLFSLEFSICPLISLCL